MIQIESCVSSDFDDKFYLIFLADRCFNSTKLKKHINPLGHTYSLRLKGNLKVTYFYNLRKHNVETYTQDLSSYTLKYKYYKDIFYTENNYKTNIVISNIPWIIAINGDPRRAFKDYSYRFGVIETLFKNQKSNVFYLESTVTCSLKCFSSLYSLVCFSTLFLSIFEADYTKNSNCYKKVNYS